VQRRFRSWELMVRSRACCGVSNHEAPMLFGLILRNAREERAPHRMRRQSGRADALLSLTSRWLTAFGDAG